MRQPESLFFFLIFYFGVGSSRKGTMCHLCFETSAASCPPTWVPYSAGSEWLLHTRDPHFNCKCSNGWVSILQWEGSWYLNSSPPFMSFKALQEVPHKAWCSPPSLHLLLHLSSERQAGWELGNLEAISLSCLTVSFISRWQHPRGSQRRLWVSSCLFLYCPAKAWPELPIKVSLPLCSSPSPLPTVEQYAWCPTSPHHSAHFLLS